MMILTYSLPLLPLFFFFQAEDGIRDGTVTGVQTCALPISDTARKHPCVQRRPFAVSDTCSHAGTGTSDRRSEERRVGKECRSRWGTDDQKIMMRQSSYGRRYLYSILDAVRANSRLRAQVSV